MLTFAWGHVPFSKTDALLATPPAIRFLQEHVDASSRIFATRNTIPYNWEAQFRLADPVRLPVPDPARHRRHGAGHGRPERRHHRAAARPAAPAALAVDRLPGGQVPRGLARQQQRRRDRPGAGSLRPRLRRRLGPGLREPARPAAHARGAVQRHRDPGVPAPGDLAGEQPGVRPHSDGGPGRQDRLPRGSVIPAGSGAVGQPTELLQATFNTYAVRADVAVPSLLVYADTYYEGWRAYVDDREVEIVRANHAFKAVRVDPGQHVVRFVFDPWTFRWGAGITLAGLAIVAGLLGWSTWRRGPQPRPLPQRECRGSHATAGEFAAVPAVPGSRTLPVTSATNGGDVRAPAVKRAGTSRAPSGPEVSRRPSSGGTRRRGCASAPGTACRSWRTARSGALPATR